MARAFGARTARLVDEALAHDFTAGIEVDASYAYKGFRADVAIELGRTFYAVLDNAQPTEPGFAASIGLKLQHGGSHAWD